MAQAGYCGLRVPEEYGGYNRGAMDTTLFLEEIARQFRPAGVWYLTGVLIGTTVLKEVGNEEQKREYLPRVARGEIRSCFGITESSGGTDALSLTTFAAETADEFVINGEKIFTTGADAAHYILLIARTKKREEVAKLSEGLSLFLVHPDTPGISIHNLKKMGWHGVHTCQVFYDDVRVPKSSLMGEKDKAWKYVTRVFNLERVSIGMTVGESEAAFEYALNYAKQRHAFGKPIGQFQAIQHHDQGMRVDIEAAKAKLVADHARQYIATKGMEILAGHGFIKDHDMERYYRNSVSLGLTKEMCRNYIGRYELGLPQCY